MTDLTPDTVQAATAAVVPDGVPPLADMTETELLDLARACVTEQQRREAATDTVRKIEALLVEARTVAEEAAEGEGPHPWVRPIDARGAYPEGWRVTDKGYTWLNLIPGNVHEPGVSGWRIEPVEGEVAPYTPVSGAHDAYHEGDRVLAEAYDGNVYVCTGEVCAHAPGVQGSGWVQEEPAEPEQPEEPTDPEEPDPTGPEPTEPDPAPWAEGEVYGVDDLATWEGQTYRCRQAHTAIAGWTPSAVPALWELAA